MCAFFFANLHTQFCFSVQFARYFCTGTVDRDASYHHYALNVSHYTHFTSPIRRYADLLVHRILASSIGTRVCVGHVRRLSTKTSIPLVATCLLLIGAGPPFTVPSDALQKYAMRCNAMKRASRLAGVSAHWSKDVPSESY